MNQDYQIQNTPSTQAANLQNAPNNPAASAVLQNSTAYTPTTGSPSPISVASLTTPVSPVSIPATTPSNSTAPYVGSPTGTTTDANGNAIIPQNGTTQPSVSDWIKTGLMNDYNALSTKGAAASVLGNTYDVAGKTQAATDAYNAYNTAKTALNQQIASIQENKNGMTQNGVNDTVANAQRIGNANLANLAVIAQSTQGNLTAAESIIKEKLDQQFQPLQDQVDFLTKFAQVNNNDLTDSEKEQMTIKAQQLKESNDSVQSAADNIHQLLLKNNVPASAYAAVDAVTQKYINGNLTASQAQSQMYQAAGRYTTQSQNTSYVAGANPVVDSHIANILNGNETMAQVPTNLRNAVSVGMNNQPTTAYSPIAASRLTTAATKITNQYTDMAAYKLTADGLPYLERIDAAIKTPGSVSDQDLLDSLTKLNTGGNAISDAQIKVITDGQSFSDMANVLKNKLSSGGVLSDTQRNQIQTIANNIYENYKKGYQPVYNQAAAQLTAAGIPKAFWTIPDLNNISSQSGFSSGNNTNSPSTVQSNGQTYSVGQVYQDGSGAKWSVDALGKWSKQ